MNEWYRTLIATAVVGLGIAYVANIQQDNDKSTKEISGETVTKTETNVSLPFFYQRRVCFYDQERISPETVTSKLYIDESCDGSLDFLKERVTQNGGDWLPLETKNAGKEFTLVRLIPPGRVILEGQRSLTGEDQKEFDKYKF